MGHPAIQVLIPGRLLRRIRFEREDAMRKISGLLLLLCCVCGALGQQKWAVPNLEELDQADALNRGRAHLSADEEALIKRVTRKTIDKCLKYVGPYDPKTAGATFDQLRVKRVELTPHGDTGLVVQSTSNCTCGAVGNCSFWLIAGGQNPRVVLAATIGVQTFAFDKAQTAGHYDLVLGQHDSATRTDLARYRFDGTRYRLQDCALLAWSDNDGNMLRKPRITRTPCQR
jgi:hypothetical protein